MASAFLLMASILLIPIFFNDKSINKQDNTSRNDIQDIARRHSQFPRIQMWNSLLNVSAISLPILLMGYFFDDNVVGYFVFSRKFLAVPMFLLGSSIASTFYPEAAMEWDRYRDMSKSTDKVIHIIGSVCIFPLLTVVILGPLLFEMVFGTEWHEAGIYAQILVPWILTSLFSSPVSTLFLIRRKAKTLLVYNIFVMIARSLPMVLGKFDVSPQIALIFLSGTSSSILLHQLGLSLGLAKVNRKKTFLFLFKETARATMLLLPVFILNNIVGLPHISLIVLGVVTIMNFVLLYRREPGLQDKVRALFRGSCD